MKLSVIGQACLLIESGKDRLIVDPWILGSCYWRSWWHLPPARTELLNFETISAIYYTHEHPDHLHFPSLRRFPSSTRILIPQFPVRRMSDSIRDRGYSHIEEIPHGHHATIGSLQLYSYQYGTDDSVIVVTDGKTTLFNMNDTKPAGLALRQILNRHPKIDFLFKSHSPAQAYPFCYTADEEKDLTLLPLSSYIDSFFTTMDKVRPHWAVPFASNICHLHPESRPQNSFLVFPQLVQEFWDKRNEAQKREGMELRLMPPGSTWDAESGFGGSAPDSSPLSSQIERVAEDHADIVNRYLKEEAALPLVTFEEFRTYLEGFAHAVPWFLRRMYPARIAFEAPNGIYFIVDLKRRTVKQKSTLPDDVHSIVFVNPYLLGDAIRKAGLNLVGISKRVRVHLKKGGLKYDPAFWGLLTVYELGYLPLRNMISVRGLSGMIRRWREFIGYIPIFIRPSKSLESIVKSKHPSLEVAD